MRERSLCTIHKSEREREKERERESIKKRGAVRELEGEERVSLLLSPLVGEPYCELYPDEDPPWCLWCLHSYVKGFACPDAIRSCSRRVTPIVKFWKVPLWAV